jgi:hypothetical protein
MPGSTAETRRLAGWAASQRDELVPKFPSIDETVIVAAGGTAGRFSAIVPGWVGGEMGSRPVTHPIQDQHPPG